ncbi:hypothetical protein TNIN_412271 [Trichonephila inaurata madagascariensis]|uniref:Uncharacterized protein n=1 Tax=Trichonephila inaurata madagascariensis TaxID=2747483 RepID=A0A8X6YBN4_9ARAC|nr:hypothetical protein TNIN_412271 [Trichonephila inaurata madagascariensis]
MSKQMVRRWCHYHPRRTSARKDMPRAGADAHGHHYRCKRRIDDMIRANRRITIDEAGGRTWNLFAMSELKHHSRHSSIQKSVRHDGVPTIDLDTRNNGWRSAWNTLKLP